MSDEWVHIAGELKPWPTKENLTEALRSNGLTVYEGKYFVRIEFESRFSFEQYGGDLGDPGISADADSLEVMIRDATLVSDALAQANIRHRFEIYNKQNKLEGYLHHKWSLIESTD